MKFRLAPEFPLVILVTGRGAVQEGKLRVNDRLFSPRSSDLLNCLDA